MSKKVEVVYENLLDVYQFAFGKPYEGEENVVELALLIRNHWKGNHTIAPHWRNRFQRILSELNSADSESSVLFLSKCT